MSKVEGVGGARPKSRHELGSRMSVLLSNPDYLLEGFAEKKCQFLGVIEDMATSSDMSDRSFLLNTLDNKRNSGKLPWSLNKENDVSVTLSAYNMKILKADRGTVLHRIPIHEIASASYINDDNQHIVFVKAGDANHVNCPCYVLICSKRGDAEELCTILQQTFQLVYTEATMEHLNESISAGERGIRGSRTSLMFVPKQKSPVHKGPSPPKTTVPLTKTAPLPLVNLSVPTVAEENINNDEGNKTVMEENETVMEGNETVMEGNETSSAVELVQDYMERLHKLLDFKELQEFATLLKQYREDLKVEDFLSKLRVLYGEQRKFLIPDMHSFIPEEDIPSFEKYLSDHNLRPKPSPVQQLHSPAADGPQPLLPPSKQELSDVDDFLKEINQDMNSILTTNF